MLKRLDTVKKLRTSDGDNFLNDNQKVGLQYYEELLPKMPRSEFEEIVSVVKGCVYQLFGVELETVICGSFRRGAEFCSGADFEERQTSSRANFGENLE